ncbi:tyrosine-type recombinase/integrase [Marinobacterium aestuariivivens]|uniref:Tyrosine-type recombinase/integrase n=1 Tax=Marinobacterium aestuariivivens TaxID=1698799 RepID=A0ABW2AA42_9GAMM
MREIAPEMRLYSPDGDRLYLTAAERKAFIAAAGAESPEDRLFCYVLHDTGCRPSEALALTADRVRVETASITFRSLKKRSTDKQGRAKQPQYRNVPVPERLIDQLDLVFDVRRVQGTAAGSARLWSMSRPTAYRLIKRVMDRAGIEGKQATGKGLRHGYGVAMVTAARPLPIHVLAKAMGHSSTKTTEIYLQVIGQEERELFAGAWGE